MHPPAWNDTPAYGRERRALATHPVGVLVSRLRFMKLGTSGWRDSSDSGRPSMVTAKGGGHQNDNQQDNQGGGE
jgi:hypothetical protein